MQTIQHAANAIDEMASDGTYSGYENGRFSKSITGSIVVSDSGFFRGYAARYLNIDRQKHFIIPGAFGKAIREFMDDGGLVLRDHSNRVEDVIATVRDAYEDATGFFVDAVFSQTPAGQDTRQKMVEKAVRKMSTVFYAKARPYKENEVHAVWKQFGFNPSERQMALAKGGALGITEVTLIDEVSVVAIPANPEAVILAVKSFDEPDSETPSEAVVVAPQVDLVALFNRARLADRVLSRF